MWMLLARCPDQELDQLIAAFHRGERFMRGVPFNSPGTPIEFDPEWWSQAGLGGNEQRPLLFVRAEYVDRVRVVEKNGLCLPLTDVTIVDRANSAIWRNRLTSPRVGFWSVE